MMKVRFGGSLYRGEHMILARVAWLLTAAVFGAACTAAPVQLRSAKNRIYNPREGTYPSLDDVFFRPKIRFTGIFQPERFTEQVGFFIFTTRKPDPSLRPVLLVHGHNTGPRHLKEIGEYLYLIGYEPWYTYYATGLDINKAGALLRKSLARFAADNDRDRVAVIGYSQGGLVTRVALASSEAQTALPEVPIFIGIANPWNGSVETRFESKRDFKPPSWDQIEDGSDFLLHLFDEPLPPAVEFHMIYGIGGQDEDLPGPDDDILTEWSLARREAVAEAKSVTVIKNARHGNIVHHYKTFHKIRALLDAAFAREPEEPSVSSATSETVH